MNDVPPPMPTRPYNSPEPIISTPNISPAPQNMNQLLAPTKNRNNVTLLLAMVISLIVIVIVVFTAVMSHKTPHYADDKSALMHAMSNIGGNKDDGDYHATLSGKLNYKNTDLSFFGHINYNPEIHTADSMLNFFADNKSRSTIGDLHFFTTTDRMAYFGFSPDEPEISMADLGLKGKSYDKYGVSLDTIFDITTSRSLKHSKSMCYKDVLPNFYLSKAIYHAIGSGFIGSRKTEEIDVNYGRYYELSINSDKYSKFIKDLISDAEVKKLTDCLFKQEKDSNWASILQKLNQANTTSKITNYLQTHKIKLGIWVKEPQFGGAQLLKAHISISDQANDSAIYIAATFSRLDRLSSENTAIQPTILNSKKDFENNDIIHLLTTKGQGSIFDPEILKLVRQKNPS